MSIAYSRCGHEYEKIFKDKESIEILKILSLINNIEEYQKIYNHVQKGIAQESRLKKNRWNKKLLNWRNKWTWINQ